MLFIHPDFTVWLFITTKLKLTSNVTCHHLSCLLAVIIVYHIELPPSVTMFARVKFSVLVVVVFIGDT